MARGKCLVIGAGVTGLAAGLASGWEIFEAFSSPGGVCSSYYIYPQDGSRFSQARMDQDAYRFEIGGGHWVFGGDPAILSFIDSIAPTRTYHRRSRVYFPEQDLYVPYPIQNHLHFLGKDVAVQALVEMTHQRGSFSTMKEWLEESFGKTLSERFFIPFHELYTAGLVDRIMPQDSYKSPVDLKQVIQGAFAEERSFGYNVTFVYPKDGLDVLTQRMASLCKVRYGKQLVNVDIQNKAIHFSDGDSISYDNLISTLPLNKMMEISGLAVDTDPDPFTSVLVLNIGAVRGQRCPIDHWLYLPQTKSGFHRVGFYSNVDPSFLPISKRESNSHVSIYVERAYIGGSKPTNDEIKLYSESIVRELQEWRYIESTEVIDPTWIDIAYTWSIPGSRWKEQALQLLQENGIYQVGRYGRWSFQGIADSIRDGFIVGSSFKSHQEQDSF